MKDNKLYEMLEIPDEVRSRLLEYSNKRNKEVPEEICKKLLLRNQWDDGIKELQNFLGDDPDGIKILWEQLKLVESHTYEEYKKRGISDEIFKETMSFCTRFLKEHYCLWGTYKYVWAWWFPRQISLNEFRISALEYEFVDGDEKSIAVHIPSDSDMSKDSVKQSLNSFYQFRKKYFPEWTDVKLTCETWMLVPELQELLGENSNIVAFQRLFEIDSIDREAVWFMDWIYPGFNKIDESLPEKTTLQRNLKKYLLEGKKFGIAKGHIR